MIGDLGRSSSMQWGRTAHNRPGSGATLLISTVQAPVYSLSLSRRADTLIHALCFPPNKFPAVRLVAARLRWQLVPPGNPAAGADDDAWDLCWLDTSVSQERLLRLQPTQVGLRAGVRCFGVHLDGSFCVTAGSTGCVVFGGQLDAGRMPLRAPGPCTQHA
jgi:hypothetical protein